MKHDLRLKKHNPNAGKGVPAPDFSRQVKKAQESVPIVQKPPEKKSQDGSTHQ